MELWLAIGLDILTAAVVLLPLIFGIIRGFKRQLLTLISLVVSAGAAFACATFLVTPIYDNYFKASVTDACIEAAGNIDPVQYADELLAEQGISVPEEELRQKLSESGDAVAEAKRIAEEKGLTSEQALELSERFSDEYLADAPEQVRSVVPKVMQKMESADIDEAELTDLLNSASASPQEGGEYVEEHFVRPTAKKVMKFVVFTVVFVFVQLLMLLIFFIMGFDIRAHGYGAADRFGGFLLGIVCAAGSLVVLCLIVSFIEKASLGLFDIETLPSKVFLPVFQFLF